MLAPVVARPLPSFLIVSLSTVAYPLLYLALYPWFSRGVGVFVLVPIIAAGWLYGSRTGSLMGLAGILLTIASLNIVEQPTHGWYTVLNSDSVPRMLVCVILGIIAGWVRRVRDQLRTQLDQLTQTQAALRNSKSRKVAVLEASPDAIVAMDDRGRILEFNAAAQQLFGYRCEEAVGRSLAELIIPPRFREPHQAVRAQYVTTGTTTVLGKRLDLIGQRADGSELPIEVVIARAGDIEPPIFTGFIRDLTGWKLIERNLRESEERYRAVVNQAADAILLIDADGRLVDANRRACESLGYSQAELLNLTISDIAPDAGNSPLQPGDTLTLDRHYLRKDGTLCPMEVRLGMVEMAGQQLRLILARDVTSRRQAEAALRKSESMLRLVWESAADGMRLTDREGTVLLANDAYCRMVGRPRTEVEGRPMMEVYAAERQPELVRKYEERFDGGTEPRYFETEVVLTNGERRCFEVGYARLELAGEPPLRLSILRDISDRKQAETALRDREELLRAVISHIPCGVFWKDQESVYLGCNDQVAHDWNFSAPSQIIGRNDLDFAVDPAEAAFFRDCDQRVLESGKPMLNIEETQSRSDGTQAILLTSKVPLRSGNGNIIGVLGIYQDITERKKLEEQYRQSQKMEAVGRLAGGVAHDFNNLLTVINGFSQILLSGLTEDDANRPMIEEILKAGERAVSLTRQLLAFGRKQMLQPRVVDLNDLIAELGKMLTRLVGEDIELRTVLAADLRSTRADPSQLEQAILNLVVNARDAMPRGGRLTIETVNVELDEEYAREHADVRSGSYVLLAVTDTGCGMDRATLARIFEPFFTTKPVGQGTGLGLATVYGIVKQMNGSIYAYSEVGIGTTFKVYLPRVEEPSPEASAASLPAAVGGREVILLVEDEESVRALTRRLLHSKGYEVLEAANGPDALALAARHKRPLHLLVTDVVMPRMSGRELATQLKQVRPAVKVLYVSGYTDDAVVRHGVLEAGALFLQKPFAPDVLARKVREALDCAFD